MVNFLIILLALFSPKANAIYAPGQVGTITACGETMSRTNLIILYATVGTAAHWTTFRLQGGTSGYTPSSTNSFTLHCIVPAYMNVSGIGVGQVAYGDNDLGLNNASAPTTPKYPGGDTNAITYLGNLTTNTTYFSNTTNPALDFKTPNTKYLSVQSGGTGGVFIAYGYETP